MRNSVKIYLLGEKGSSGFEDKRIEIINDRVVFFSIFFGLFLSIIGLLDTMLLPPNITSMYANQFIIFGLILVGFSFFYRKVEEIVHQGDDDKMIFKTSYPGLVMIMGLMLSSYAIFTDAYNAFDVKGVAHLAQIIPTLSMLLLMILPFKLKESILPIVFIIAISMRLGFNDSDGFTYVIDFDVLLPIAAMSLFVFLSQVFQIGIVNDLMKQSSIDSFTGLLNRYQFVYEAEKMMINNPNEVITMVLFNLDEFKHINLSYGYSSGDKILRRVGEKITAHFGAKGLCSRFSGEEFAVLVKGENIESVIKSVAKIMADFRSDNVSVSRFDGGVDVVHYTSSIGVSQWDGNQTLEELARDAERNVFACKAQGRDCASIDGKKVFR